MFTLLRDGTMEQIHITLTDGVTRRRNGRRTHKCTDHYIVFQAECLTAWGDLESEIVLSVGLKSPFHLSHPLASAQPITKS